MSIFSNMTTEGMEQASDVLGGFTSLESGIYPAMVKALYVTESKSGAMALNLIADINGREYRETIYITNKDKQNYYLSKKTGKKVPLPGFTTIDDLCLCGIGKHLSETSDPQPKTIKVYDFDAKAEILKEVPMVTDMIGAKVLLGILREIVDKNTLQGNEYVPSGETREQNTINKVFHSETHKTVPEATQGKEKAEFYDKWIAKYEGKTIDRSTKGVGKTVAKPAPAPAPKKSLFS